MGFKANASFLRFLTMGALGVRSTMQELRRMGFKPIELERHCASNKIWTTKVKRLRLPDLLCVQTGLRLEVRAKSDLKIRMSDAPTNPDRVWDAGLRDSDLIAFIACFDGEDGMRAAEEAEYFTVEALRASSDHTKLGQPKSASEGAERDRTWPTTVPSRPGRVLEVDGERIVVNMEGDDAPERRQTYRLNGKTPYVGVGDTFKADTMFIAGVPPRTASPLEYADRMYDPVSDLRADHPVDRYAAVKALPHREDRQAECLPELVALIERAEDERIALEAAATAAFLGSKRGEDYIRSVLTTDGRADLKMEAVFILGELGSDFARQVLASVAKDASRQGDELRQAATWGLGKAGLGAYEELLELIDDSEDEVAMHALVAFDRGAPDVIIAHLIQKLALSDGRTAAAASEALVQIGDERTIRALATEPFDDSEATAWRLVTLSRLPVELVDTLITSPETRVALAPLRRLSGALNWLADDEKRDDLSFLLKQSV